MRRIWSILGGQMNPSYNRLPTRRDVFRALGTAVAGTAVRRDLSGRTWIGMPRIGIVGAGIAGMTAALTLQDGGIPCSVYESSGRIGGRMHSNRTFWPQGQSSEWCGEFIDSDHHTIRNLAGRFNIPLLDLIEAEPAGSVETDYFLDGYYLKSDLANDLATIVPILKSQRKAIGPNVLYNHYNQAAYQFDHMSSWDWIETYVPGGHGSRLGRYLDVVAVTENGLDSQQNSSLNLIYPLHSDERYRMKNGNERLPKAIAKSLPDGTVNLGWRLTTIAANSNQTVTLTFATRTGTQSLTFDYVILALPFSVLRGLDLRAAQFDELKMTAINQLGYGTNSKLVLQFDQRYWNSTGAWPGAGNGEIKTDLPFQKAWDTSRAEPGSNGLLSNYSGGTQGASFRPSGPYTTSRSSSVTADYAQQFLTQAETVWPGLTPHYNGLAALSYPTGDPNLLGSYSCYTVGQYTLFAGYEHVPQNRVYFAGEHTSYNAQGYMEGGARSGKRAAHDVLQALGASDPGA